MSFDVLDRANQALSDYAWAKSCKVEPAPWPNRLIEDLAAEVKKLRWLVAHGDGDHMCDECWPNN